MAYCKKYHELGWMDQKVMQATIIHLIQKDAFTFDQVTQLIRLAEAVGLLDRVKFGSQVNSKQVL